MKKKSKMVFIGPMIALAFAIAFCCLGYYSYQEKGPGKHSYNQGYSKKDLKQFARLFNKTMAEFTMTNQQASLWVTLYGAKD